MINIAEMFADGWKFDDQSRWEDVATCLGYVITVDLVRGGKKEIKTLLASTKDGENRGMFFTWMKDSEPVKGFLVDKPMCGCGHSH